MFPALHHPRNTLRHLVQHTALGIVVDHERPRRRWASKTFVVQINSGSRDSCCSYGRNHARIDTLIERAECFVHLLVEFIERVEATHADKVDAVANLSSMSEVVAPAAFDVAQFRGPRHFCNELLTPSLNQIAIQIGGLLAQGNRRDLSTKQPVKTFVDPLTLCFEQQGVLSQGSVESQSFVLQ